ncbi:hypothetical protein H9Y04_24645 [Streptomyces sp. TRM66268-LWL]|uniref:Uncharacterized protein n=1 Tax=Streptomyces polyasparticus TaxID=2767826 RepID=A0ABR7SML0_9ACTN|nr:hypothetical protein [Streptomyces polyasparticus]MBC9715736.1 hypothetical protein [Streptomyces polyasparticus]
MLLELLQPAGDGVPSFPSAAGEFAHGDPPAVPVGGDQSEDSFGFETQPPVAEQRVGDLREVISSHQAALDAVPEATHHAAPVAEECGAAAGG